MWWFFLFWLPKFLHERFAVSLLDLGPPLVVIYLASDAGSIAGGWFSSHLIKRGWSVDSARKTSIFAFGLLAVPIFYAAHTTSLWTAIGLISLGTAAHQACSGNIFTIMSDIFPRRIVGSVVGLSGFFGAVSGALIAEFVGFVLTRTGSYTLLFSMFSFAYIVAWIILKVGIPVIRPIEL